jgi:signal transduction histidine kinase
MSSSNILNFLVNDILDFAQVKDGKFRKNLEIFDLKESVEEIIAVQKYKAA